MTYEFSWLLSFLSYYYYYYLCGYLIPLPWGNVDTQYEVQLPTIQLPFSFFESPFSFLFFSLSTLLSLQMPAVFSFLFICYHCALVLALGL